ncbi:MAG TPA: condensation domain-containing protein, partial [Myxococcales bacterium]|nr:condensation domain-containing protein [Myxococcales bacterium]
NGKVDRKALPPPGDARDAAGRAHHVAPRSGTEEQLARIWSEVLGVERVGVEDSFFELGGDSILAIQVVSRANAAGLKLEPRQLFQHQTIAALAPVAERRDPAAPEARGPVTGEAPLTPVQRWFIDLDLEAPHHWNQSVVLEARGAINAGALEQALAQLALHHDALRLRLERTASGWAQRFAAPAEEGWLRRFDASALPAGQEAEEIERWADALQASLDLSRGPLLRAGLVQRGGRPPLLILAIHHLAVDGVSWRILLEDLSAAYAQAAAGRPISLPARTASYQAWARRLQELAGSGEIDPERRRWLELPWDRARPLPVDLDSGEDVESTGREVTVELSAEETRRLLQQSGDAYRTQVDELLLAALAQALARALGDGAWVVDLERHGRDAPAAGLDVSRTVGWFTSIAPLLLEGRAAWGPAEAIPFTKERIRSMPGRGFSYGLARHLRPDGGGLASLPRAGLIFNYLGQLDQAVPAEAPFALSAAPGGRTRDGRARRPHLVDVNAGVIGGRLQVSFGYSDRVHRRETIQAWAAAYREALREVTGHCSAGGAGRVTPSDFPLAGLDQAGLDRLPVPPREIEDLYPLSAMQQAFWSSALSGRDSVGVEQTRFVLEGALDLDHFARAWSAVVDRHAVLRTRFISGDDRPLQLVQRRAALPIQRQDLSGLAESEQRARIEAFVTADRLNGFELGQPPLMRLACFRTAERRYELLWSFHHLVLDGWSLALLVQEVVALYEGLRLGRPPALTPPPRFRDYVAWQAGRDPAGAERYWRRALGGLTAATPLAVDRTAFEPRAPGHREHEASLPAAATARLELFARQHQLSLNTVLHAAWALVLSRYSGEPEVMFGTTVSGRP